MIFLALILAALFSSNSTVLHCFEADDVLQIITPTEEAEIAVKEAFALRSQYMDHSHILADWVFVEYMASFITDPSSAHQNIEQYDMTVMHLAYLINTFTNLALGSIASEDHQAVKPIIMKIVVADLSRSIFDIILSSTLSHKKRTPLIEHIESVICNEKTVSTAAISTLLARLLKNDSSQRFIMLNDPEILNSEDGTMLAETLPLPLF